MLRGRLSPASLYLCLVCLLGLPTQPAAKPCRTEDLLTRLNKTIINTTLQDLTSRLYTPTREDFQKCPRSTLRCLSAEIHVLFEEWKTITVQAPGELRMKSMLEKLQLYFSEKEPMCRKCELLQEKNAEEFLKQLHEIIQMANMICSKDF
ncbi:interleukin-15-like isoform X2 [Anoplopoma fimbria]|uniref:interleukin-15-like isoform X2 n=1 Tax=Anoplopoma fimbria TaxID=229290 RepID=UPI0023EBDD97|nr:interleukin-15-like isoform X2 [Anoplopoma fimbria]